MQFLRSEQWPYFEKPPIISNEQLLTWVETNSVYFETIAEKLPKGFVKIYKSNEGFHDFIISSIQIENKRPNKINIEIQLDGDYPALGRVDNKISLLYRDVQNYSIYVPKDKKWFFSNMQWLYDEFFLNDNGLWTHKIMCDGKCGIKFDFKKISIKKL